MNTYDPQTTLDAISHNGVAVVAIGGLSILAMFVLFILKAPRALTDSAVSTAPCCIARERVPGPRSTNDGVQHRPQRSRAWRARR